MIVANIVADALCPVLCFGDGWDGEQPSFPVEFVKSKNSTGNKSHYG